MKLASIPLIIAVIVGVVLFTNVDESISESIEFDTSTLNFVTNTWPIDSVCDVYLVQRIEYEQPNPSQWYLDNFSEERESFLNAASNGDWLDDGYRASIFIDYFDSLDKKTTPELRNYQLGGVMSKETAQEDPQCYKIFLDKYPNRLYG
ncbi:MAG: hypothetical protein JKY15_01950 [Deltaproteobacteria bacterium]|nr:hypothetical protein [Deltaproteobacteria bacterium]